MQTPSRVAELNLYGRQNRRTGVHVHMARWLRILAASFLCVAASGQAARAQTPVSITPPNLAGPVAGSARGSASVDPGGAAHYSIPIPVPPGTAGMAPSLSLEYSSQAGMGLLGRGWGIGGMSAISRCGKTIAQDTVRTAVTLTVTDQFCLDGKRLLLVSGTHGATAEYRTELDTFSQVLSTGSNTAKGPDSWTVKTKGGLIYTYGGTTDSTIEAQGASTVLTWAVSRVQDRRSNYYDYVYTENNANGEYYPIRIRYTGNLTNGQAAYNAVNFVYASRPDPWQGYVAGTLLRRTQRLTAVRTNINTAADGSGGTLVRDYRVAYTANAISGRSLVDTITDCDGAGNCLPVTKFQWSVHSAGANTFSAAGSGNWGGPAITFEATGTYGPISDQLKSGVLMGDFDGDGKTDLLYSDGSGTWKMCRSTGSAFACQNWVGPAVRTREVLLGDFNGDGRTDMVVPPLGTGTGLTWQLCLSTGTGFSCSNWTGPSSDRKPNYYMVADFDGDGLDDIAIYGTIWGTYDYLCKSTGTTFPTGCVTYSGVDVVLNADAETQARIFRNVGDFTGDGRADVLLFVAGPNLAPGNWNLYRATDTGFVAGIGAAGAGPGASSTFQNLPGLTRFVDHNGDPYDSYADILVGFSTTTPPYIQRCASTGTAMACNTTTAASMTQAIVNQIADYDGDGRLDALTGDGVCQISDQGALYACQAWTAAAPVTGAVATLYGDFNGDGYTDSATYSSTTSSWTVNLAGNGGYADLMSIATDGLGRITRFDYKGLNDPTVYTLGGAVGFPQRNLTQGSPVVSEVRVDNALGGFLTNDYTYEALRVDVQGRGFLGFGKSTAIDQVNGITAVTTASQTFPFIGMPLTETATQTNGARLRSTANILASFATAGGAVYPYISASTVTTRDLGDTTNTGTPIATVTSQINGTGGIDAYGNILSSTDTVNSGGDTFTTNTVATYDNLTANWLIGLKRSATVTKTVAYGDSGISAPALILSNCASTTPTTLPALATLTCTLGNTGQSPASTVTLTSPAGTTKTGPGNCPAGTANCGTVTVTAGGAGTFSGTLVATPNTGTAASVAVSLTVYTPATLALTGCSSTSPTIAPTAARLTCTLSNTGQIAAASISYSAISGTTVAGPTGTCAAGATCGTVTVTTGTTAGTYSGTLTATPNSGVAASTGVSLVVNTPAALTFSGCSNTSPTTTPTAAVQTCTLSNTGQTGIASISYSAISGATVSGPTGACAASATCGTVTVTTGTAAATYSGTLIATPNAGTAASTSISLTVRTAAALAFSGCASTSPTITPTAATLTCTLSNSGQTPISSITYSAIVGATVSGPTGACAGGASCGTVTVTSGTGAATYSGTLTATPNAGSAASTGVSLVVNTPAALSFSGCSSTSPTTAPTAAVQTCTLSNTGQTGISSVSYSAIAGTTVAGPTGACAGGATCGTVTVTTGTTAATYAGTLTATPNAGAAASTGISLVVNTPAVLAFSGCSSTSPTTTPTAATLTCTLSNSGQAAVSSITYSAIAGASVSGPTGACAGGATCGTVTVTSSTAAGTYSGTLTATPNTGSAASQGVSLTVYTAPALALSSCSNTSPTTAPTAAVQTCTVSNTGQAAAGSISYSAITGATVSGPTGACAGGATCGTVTVTTGTAAGTYSGTLTATPSTGSAASTAVSLVVNTPAALALTSCSNTSPTTTPTAAVQTCTLSNTGQTGVSSISYSAIAGSSVSGPTGACAGGATCGTVTVTTGTAAGTYSGTLTATPNVGSAASTSVSLVVNAVPVFTFVSNSGQVLTNTINVTATFKNNGSAAATITAVGSTNTSGDPANVVIGAASTCVSGNSLGAGATCTVVLNATRTCANYNAAATLSNAGGTTTGSNYVITKKAGAC